MTDMDRSTLDTILLIAILVLVVLLMFGVSFG